MKLQILGGVGEYGRACFFVSSDGQALLLDCGISKEKGIKQEQKYPLLTSEHAAVLEAVFLTHSHADHCGALPYLLSLGYQGKVYSTRACFEQVMQQLHCSTREKETLCQRWVLLDDGGPDQDEIQLGKLKIQWGRSGHLAGSVWYLIHAAGKTLFYSGDFSTESILYHYDLPDPHQIDLAIIDNAYGTQCITQAEVLAEFNAVLEEQLENGSSVLLPLPTFGRSQDILAHLVQQNERWQVPLIVQEEIMAGLSKLLEQPRQIKEHAQRMIAQVKRHSFIHLLPAGVGQHRSLDSPGAKLILTPDGMLESRQAQELVQKIQQNKHLILLTGHQAKDTFGYTLLHQGSEPNLHHELIRYKVHQETQDVRRLLLELQPASTLLFHAPQQEWRQATAELSRDFHLLAPQPGQSIKL